MSELVLVAVSGGSDSLALLHRLASQNIIAATVDHSLRPEAKDEAVFVAEICRKLGISHTTLTWQPNGKSAQAARLARYDLLTRHARQNGASTIALGHTLDDQAETLIMRAFRAKAKSSTRGMSGMTQWATYEGIKLWRPMLNETRKTLHDELRARNIRWIDDPSNIKLESERVRVRRFLSTAADPSKREIAQFANLSARSRAWLSNRAAEEITQAVKQQDGILIYHYRPNTPFIIRQEVFSTLILVAGGQPFRPAIDKFTDLVGAFGTQKSTRKAVGRCLVQITPEEAKFQREERNLPPQPAANGTEQIFDGRLKILPDGTRLPYISALERFRPSLDDSIFSAVMTVLR